MVFFLFSFKKYFFNKDSKRVSNIPETLKSVAEHTLDQGKAEDVITINLQGKTDIADYMIIATGLSSRHVHAMADQVVPKLKKAGAAFVQTEGLEKSDWVLIDCGDVIIHLFRPEVREFYDLEKMWALPSDKEDKVHVS